MEKAYLFLNGEAPPCEVLTSLLSEVKRGEVLLVCADGAFSYIKNYFLPHVVVGDFDSLSRSEVPSCVEILQLPEEKDFTDGHVATEYIINKGIKELVIYGGGGKRADHMLSNLSLLMLAARGGVSAKMDDGNFFIYLSNSHFSIETSKGKIISLVPYSDHVHILYTKGLKYPIVDGTLDKVHILGISNEATEPRIEFAITSGWALVFVEK